MNVGRALWGAVFAVSVGAGLYATAWAFRWPPPAPEVPVTTAPTPTAPVKQTHPPTPAGVRRGLSTAPVAPANKPAATANKPAAPPTRPPVTPATTRPPPPPVQRH